MVTWGDWDGEEEEHGESEEKDGELEWGGIGDDYDKEEEKGVEGVTEMLRELNMQEFDEDEDKDIAVEEGLSTVKLMKLDVSERQNTLLELAETISTDAIAAARRDENVLGEKGLQSAMWGVMHSLLLNFTEARRLNKAVHMVENIFPLHGVKLDQSDGFAMVRMFVRAKRLSKAVETEVQMREQHNLPPDQRSMGAILNAYACRRDKKGISRTLSVMQGLGMVPRESDLKFVRIMSDKGKFAHAWIPPDPNANLKQLVMEAKELRKDSKEVKAALSRIHASKYI
ncbi:unnamed protein product [Discosporangium mesarthrocarpum]